jgi:FkbM family methyltransferase
VYFSVLQVYDFEMSHFRRFVKRSFLAPAAYAALEKLREIAPTKNSFLGYQFRGTKEMLSGSYESYLLDFLVPLLDESTSFINIGANVGYFASVAKSKGVSRVIAIEPNLSNFNILVSNLKNIETSTKVDSLNIAVGEKNQSGELFGHSTGASLIKNWEGDMSKSGAKVQIRTLDSLVEELSIKTKSIFLIDVEGSEFSFLLGAQKTLISHQESIWIVEISLFRNIDGVVSMDKNFAKTLELFERQGYFVYSWLNGFNQLSRNEIQGLASGFYKLSALIFVFSKRQL